ncbi:LOW QUALITY PROTEIN: alsin homolog [Drosophila busckii]|uniref:LOW QUALITY PROTEIN: alsin homolog n=1 Tax=Drosophila busckii TaxID=30019 RepID=UPI0014332D17|nr:LOW QUALITY PROTEIN: alsin homolog [Drosophila busckii]
MSTSYNCSNSDEAFAIYFEGQPLRLKWQGVPPLTRMPAMRLCHVAVGNGTNVEKATGTQQSKSSSMLLLTTDQSLYWGELVHATSTLELNLLRSDIIDVDYCQALRQLFVVTANGSVHCQLLTGGYRAAAWQTLSFDPLELLDEGVTMRRVCCSAQGVVFVSDSGTTYVLGSCGEVFNAEQPRHMRLCEEGKQLLDLAAGDEHFVLLVAPHQLADEVLQLQQPQSEEREPERGSTKSLNSGCSDRSFSSNRRHLLQQGYALLNTQLFTFGASNNGLLGTGDHIRRAHVARLEKLDGMGVCSIAVGKQHSVVRTLDGRLYHWGLNTREQLGEEFSSPTEICIADQLLPEQLTALEATCGDYRTLLLNAAGQIQTLPQLHSHSQSQSSTYEQTLLHLHLGAAWPRQLRLLYCAGGFTLQNRRQFQRQYHYYLSHLESQLQLLLKQRQAVQTLVIWELAVLEALLLNWERIVCLVAATLHSLEGFYRSDYVLPADLLFICYYREYIELFEDYTKCYCDVLSVNGFSEAAATIGSPPLSSVNPLAELAEESYLTRLFQQPFGVYQLFMQFLELLVRAQSEYEEHRLAWSEFARLSCISQELAVNTKEFWSSKECTPRIYHLKQRYRRVILTSALVPLKLSSSNSIGIGISMSSNSFILFSDFLCQLGSHSLHTYPLQTLWLFPEGDLGIRVLTPEKSFLLVTRKSEARKVWLDQLQSSIVSALGRPLGSNVPNVRTTGYEFNEHPRFAKVKAWGTWRRGVLHGNCYLEYPDGSVYCGSVHHGVIEGYGKMVIPSTGVYVGNFKGGRFHGFGVYELHGSGAHDSEIYEGNFYEGLYNGHGMMRNNRYIYVGEYVANTRSGYGVMEDLVSGDKYMGMFVDNKRCGTGSCITHRGDYFEGNFSNDDLTGSGVAVFENDYYYEGELTLQGPNGRGEYYMPSGDAGNAVGVSEEGDDNYELVGNKVFGQLSGSWETVRIQAGELALNRCFSKYPSSLGRTVVDHYRKWRALFHNFESDVASCSVSSTGHSSNHSNNFSGSIKKPMKTTLSTAQLWSCIAVYMSKQRSRDASKPGNYFNNILLSLPLPQKSPTPGLKSSNQTSTLVSSVQKQQSTLNLLNSSLPRIHSQETLCSKRNSLKRSDSLLSMGHNSTLDSRSLVSFELDDSLVNRSFNDSSRTSVLSSKSQAQSNHNNNNNNSISKNNSNCSITSTTSTSSSMLDQMPSFGMASALTEQDVSSIRLYLEQAFKDPYHPLYALNERIANCFHYSYGYWKVKPTPILAKQAMREWESISKRIYRFVRKMFPALPEDFCFMDDTKEVISHITLLYPLVLSEGIYSTLFVLYANKYNRKDELYRQNLNHAEKLSNNELAQLLGHDSSLISVMLDPLFHEAVQMLKQLQEKFSPQDMLTVIQRSMEMLTQAYEHAMASKAAQLNADNMIPLSMMCMLRAAVPHLGAELALLDDLTGGPNFQAEMNGMAGYCYTTLKAAYEHVTMRVLQRTL